MQCSECKHENPSGTKFCGECGARLAQACPACAHLNPSGQKFCGECGAALTGADAPAAGSGRSGDQQAAAPRAAGGSFSALRDATPAAYTPKHLAERILTSRSAIEGERKQVTVLFSDVSGYTAMSERLDPEEVHDIMDRAFEIVLNEVHRYEGTINQFLGDGVMALFGAPIAYEDHPQRALRAALAIQEGLGPLSEDVHRDHGVQFRMRIGINTGLVVVGAIGRDLRTDYTAVGDTTNLAARLLNVAQPGQIVISEQTHRLTDGFFVSETLGEFSVKGKTAPVRAYAVTGERRGRTRLEVSKDRGLTRLVGREAEVRRLTAAYRLAVDGNGGIVLVAGEPGAGKSRLLYEFLSGLADEGVIELETTCLSHGRSMPYHPILELLRRHLDLPGGIADERLGERVAERLAPLALDEEHAAPLLAHFLGATRLPEALVGLSGAQLKERTLRVLRSVLLQTSTATPAIVVVENVHWLDASSEEFLHYFTEDLPGHRLLLVLSTRPGASLPWLGSARVETISVEGLHAEAVGQMIRVILEVDRVSEALLRIVLTKGEGNPLYVEEILRQLQETGGLSIADGEAVLNRTDMAVPQTVHDIIASRIDRLRDPLKHTLQIGAVVGREFAVALLAQVLATNGELSEQLHDLHALDFVFPSVPEPDLVYSFKHALTQEVAYTSLLERRRRQYHAAVAESLERLYAGRIEKVVELLAYHFGLSPHVEQAVDYAILAAEKAQRRWANTEALALFESAVKRLDAMPDTEANRRRRIDAVVKQGEIKFALGRHAEHVQALEAIREIVETAADPPRRAAWCYWAGFLHSLTGARPDVSIAYCREAVAIADAGGLADIRAFAECALAHVYLAAGDLRASLEAGERALAWFAEQGNVWWACRALWALNPAANGLGLWNKSLAYCRRALDYGRDVEDLRLKIVGWWRTGATHIQQGDPEAGRRCCEEALALSPGPFDAAMVKGVMGYGGLKAGRLAEAERALTEAVAWFDQSHLHYTKAVFAVRLAETLVADGRATEAQAMLAEVLTTSRERGNRYLEGVAERVLGDALAAEPAAATRHFAIAASILDEIGARDELARTLMGQARLRLAAGDRVGAGPILTRALALFEACDTLDEPPRVRATLASLADR